MCPEDRPDSAVRVSFQKRKFNKYFPKLNYNCTFIFYVISRLLNQILYTTSRSFRAEKRVLLLIKYNAKEFEERQLTRSVSLGTLATYIEVMRLTDLGILQNLEFISPSVYQSNMMAHQETIPLPRINLHFQVS